MGRLIATIKYGSLKTKLFLLTVFILLVGGAILAVYGGTKYELWALALGALMLIVGLVMLLMANFSTETVEQDDDDEEDDESSGRQLKKSGNAKRTGNGSVNDRTSDDTNDNSRTVNDRTGKSRTEKHRFGSNKEYPGGELVDIEYPDDYEDEDLNEESEKPRKRVKKQKGDTVPERIEEEENEEPEKRVRKSKGEPDTDERISVEDAEEGEEPGERPASRKPEVEREIRNTPENNNELVGKYTAVLFRQLLHRYKVKRDYIPIIIDDSRKFDTSKTPALCWVKRKNVFFLLMEGNERVESMPLHLFLQVTYKRDVKENNLAAYSKIKDDMGIYEKFADVMPTFNSVQSRRGISTYTKNQYVLGGTVAVTPRSMRALRSRFTFDMKLFDSMGITGEHSIYFKRASEARVLWTDQVIGQQEYQNMIGAILQQMVDDRSIGKYDFLDDLEKMIENRLITNEYADYYMQQRQKRDRETRKR